MPAQECHLSRKQYEEQGPRQDKAGTPLSSLLQVFYLCAFLFSFFFFDNNGTFKNYKERTMFLSPCSHCPTLWHQDWPHTPLWAGVRPLGKALSGLPARTTPGARVLFLWAPREGAPGAVPGSTSPSSLSKPEPGAGNIRGTYFGPHRGLFRDFFEPSPNRQEMTPQPSPVAHLVLSPVQLTPQWSPWSSGHPCHTPRPPQQAQE